MTMIRLEWSELRGGTEPELHYMMADVAGNEVTLTEQIQWEVRRFPASITPANLGIVANALAQVSTLFGPSPREAAQFDLVIPSEVGKIFRNRVHGFIQPECTTQRDRGKIWNGLGT